MASQRVAWLCHSLLLCIYFQADPVQCTDIKLGFLYIQSGPGEETNWGASWVQESFSQFKLGIKDVNANSSILPNHTLSFKIADTSGDEAIALKGATTLVDDVVGIIGTGYSSALRLPGGYCGVFKKPMVSPGSTLLSLIDKTSMPYVMRSISSDSGVLKAMVAIIYDLGWRRSVVMVNKGFEDGAIQVLRPAMVASGITQLTLVYSDPDDSNGSPIEANRRDLQEKMKLIKSSGYRIIALYSKSVDFPAINETSSMENVGFWSSEYVWILGSSGWVSPLYRAPQVLSAAAESSKTARKVWYDERWARVTTLWNASVHGGYDPETKLPFYGANAATDYTVWDTDYAEHGDGKPDKWGEYVYDTVWLYAYAMHAMLLSGKDVNDGEELRKQLLQTKFEGVTGNVVFDRSSQDRIEPIVIYMSSSTGPVQAGKATEHLQDWDLSGPCTQGCTTLTPATVKFPGGAVPSDGRMLDVQKSFFSSGDDSYTEGREIKIIAQVRNSFNQVPCQSPCSANQTSIACSSCLEEFADYHEIVPIFEMSSSGEVLQPAMPLVYDVQASSGTLRITLPGGLIGAGTEDRQATLRLHYKSIFFNTNYKITFTSDACPAGFYATPKGCTQCRAGNFTARRGATECERCEAGSYQDQDGATACMSCQPGTYQSSMSATQCFRCKAGTYTSVPKSVACTDCEGERTTKYEGAIDKSGCLCKKGFYEARKFPSTQGSSACLPCPLGFTCPGLQQGVSVKAGFYVTLPLDPANGAWKCRPKEACLGAPEANISIQTICAKDSTGQNCGTCVEGTYINAPGECAKCDGGDGWLLPLFLVAIFGLCGFFHILWNYRSNTVEAVESVLASITFGVTISFIQQLGILNNLRFNWPSEFRDLLNVFKVLIFDFGFLKMNCLYEQTLASGYSAKMLVPLVVIGIFVTWWAVSRPIHMMIDRFPAFSIPTVHNSIGMILQAVYISIVSGTCSYFECFESGPNGESVMVRYPWVLCSDSERMVLLPLAIAGLLIYVIGFFGYLCWLCYMAPRRALDENFQHGIRFLIFKFRPDTWWYCLVLLARSLVLAMVPLIVTDDGYLQMLLVQFLFIGSVIAHLIVQPYQDAYANNLESVELTLMLVILGLATWFIEERDYDSVENKDKAFRLSVALIVAVIVCLVTLVVVFIWAITLIAKPGMAKRMHEKQVKRISTSLKSLCEQCLQLNDIERCDFVGIMTYMDWNTISHLSNLADLELSAKKSTKRLSRSNSNPSLEVVKKRSSTSSNNSEPSFTVTKTKSNASSGGKSEENTTKDNFTSEEVSVEIPQPEGEEICTI